MTGPTVSGARVASLLVGLLLAGGGALAGRADEERAFQAEMSEAMDRMMVAMHVRPCGDVDRDFVAMMIPHHQGAIDMARAQLRHGRDERLRRLAQEIIVTQGQEIEVMRLLTRGPQPSGAPSATVPAACGASAHGGH